MLRQTLNLGILAHVDAGKTTLTERLLFAAGAISDLGSVDRGDTHTDTLLLEQERGITIKAAVASFTVGDLAVNLVDTPGHPDFIAEVDRVLAVLDGAILVISAVEGVQSHSVILMRALLRLGVPTVLFVNKIDRAGADAGRVLGEIAERLSPAVAPMSVVSGEGTRAAAVHSWDRDDDATARLAELLAARDDDLLATLLGADHAPTRADVRRSLSSQSREGLIHPVFVGSALTGSGVDDLLCGVAELLPAAGGDPEAPASGVIFKIERGRRNEKVVYVRMRAGTIREREVVHLGADGTARLTAIRAFQDGTLARRPALAAGEIGVLTGLRGARIGDQLGSAPGAAIGTHFAPPTLESVVLVRRHEDRVRLGAALAQLAEEDPLTNVRLDETRGELSVCLYGEVQKEVLATTLARDFGIEVDFSETTTVYVERPLRAASAVERIAVAPNPFNATIGLHVEPLSAGAGVSYRRAPDITGLMPNAYFLAVEDTVRETLRQGAWGWEVVDCAVRMTHAGFWGKHGLGHQYFNKSLSSTGEDFRKLAPLVLARALHDAGTVVCEPIDWLRLDVPADAVELVTSVLRGLRATTTERTLLGARCVVTGTIPAGSVHRLQQRLPDLTRGEGVAETGFSHHAPVSGDPPRRVRIGPDPFDRVRYLQQLGVRGSKAIVASDG